MPTPSPGTESVLRSRPDKFHLCHITQPGVIAILRRLRDNVKLVQERRYKRPWPLGLPRSTLGGDLIMQDRGQDCKELVLFVHGEVARNDAAQCAAGAGDLAEQGVAVGDGEGAGAVGKIVDRAG